MRRDDFDESMSLSDILDEVGGFDFYEDEDESLDEILVEFSDMPDTIDKEEKSEEPKEEKKLSVEEEIINNLKLFENDPETEKKEEKADSGKKKPDIRKVETIVRPWEDGTYGDIKQDEEPKKPVRDRKHKVSAFAETFDTFTRSELFEDKTTSAELDTRSVEEIIAENSKVSKLLGFRVILLLILSVLSCYLAFADPLSWYMPSVISYISHPFRYLFLTVFVQVSAMLLTVDIISRGIGRLFKLHPNVESAIAFSSFATLAHVISVMAAPHWRGWLPYSCISVITLFFALYGKWLNSKALRRICRTVRSAKLPEQVHVEDNDGEINIVRRTSEDTHSFISHIDDKDASRTFWTYLSPVVIIASVVFAAIASFGTKTPQHFFWVLSGVSCVSTPFFAMFSFALPFSITEKNLSSIGSAISGWYSASNLSKRSNFVITDRDIFPKGTVTLHGLKVLGDYSLEQTVSYAASVIAETQSGLCDVFSDLLKSRYGQTTEVRSLRYHESGGVEAEIGEDKVLLGGAGFMLRSSVHLNSGTNTRNALFIAINGSPAGVFNINYKANSEIERALHTLIRKRIFVILAVRDFNLTPTMIEETFNLKKGYLDYPEIEQRLALSDEDKYIRNDALAVITRSGIQPVAATLLAAKKLRRATIRNICLTTAASVIGMLLMFYLMFMQKPILVTPHTVFVYMMLWFVSTFMMSLRVK